MVRYAPVNPVVKQGPDTHVKETHKKTDNTLLQGNIHQIILYRKKTDLKVLPIHKGDHTTTIFFKVKEKKKKVNLQT